MVFDSIPSNIDEVLLINPSANVFGDFNVHYKDWHNYSGGTDRSSELCYNFSISNNLTQMGNFPARIPDCDSHNPALLDLFHFSDTSICSTMAFPPLGNSDHVVVSISIDFLSNSKQDAPFHCIAYDYSHADWDGLCDHLRDVPWEYIFKLSASAATSHHCKTVLEAAKLAYPNKTSPSPSLPRDLARGTFLNKGKFPIPALLNGGKVLFSGSDGAKLFAENFSKNSNLDDSGISLPVCPSRTNLKLHNIYVTPKMVEKIITNLALSKAF